MTGGVVGIRLAEPSKRGRVLRSQLVELLEDMDGADVHEVAHAIVVLASDGTCRVRWGHGMPLGDLALSGALADLSREVVGRSREEA